MSAQKFFYRITVGRPEVVANLPNPKLPKRLPVVLSREEVLAIFEATHYIKHKAMVTTTYGAGLRNLFARWHVGHASRVWGELIGEL